MAETPQKKVVRVEAPQASGDATARDSGPVWTPEPAAKAKATQLRWISWVAWILAIGVQAFAIFWVLKQVPINMWLLVGAIVVTGALSVTGSYFWKQANRLDPASKADTVRFFVQNQLGAIMTVVTFLPLIVLILLNKNMSGKQKALAAGIGIVIMLIATVLNISYQSPSQEQYAEETNIVQQLTGVDNVFWVKGGSVFHVCAAVPDVNKESQDGQIYEGTVAAAHAAGKERLTKRWQSEAVKYCGFTQEQVDAVDPARAADAPADQAPAEEAPTEEAPASEVPAE
ncbi:hypothetical protein D3248_06165 [Leucobacter zeae]|nr:hypothetical protein [Leucobacter zeae]